MVMSEKLYNFQHFIDAQDQVYDRALDELKAGEKQSHWMWFIFPQTPKPKMSSLSKQFTLTSKKEARMYLDHPVLGERLIECTQAVLAHADRSLVDIFGSDLDAVKFISCMQLFKHVGGEESVFVEALRVFGKE